MTKKEAKKLLKDYKDFLNKEHKGMYCKISDYSLNKYVKEQLTIHDVSIMLPDQKEIISKGVELAKQGKIKNDKASIKDYLFGFIDGFRYTKYRIETKGN